MNRQSILTYTHKILAFFLYASSFDLTQDERELLFSILKTRTH
jgi:hypothetical protein